MVLERIAHARGVQHHGDAVLFQQVARPHAGQLQQLRRVERAAREDHLARRPYGMRLSALPVLDADGIGPLEQNARCQRLGLHPEVRSLECGPQVPHRSTGTPAVTHGRLVVAGAFLAGAIEIVVPRDPERLRRSNERIGQFKPVGQVAHGLGPAHPVPLVCAALLVLGLDEIGQQAFVVPAWDAPFIEVLALAPDVDEPVDGGRTAQHLAARREDPAPVQLRFGFRLVAPVRPGLGEKLPVAQWNVNPRIRVAGPGLEQQDRMPAVRRQAVGQYTTGRSSPDDDVVDRLHAHRGTAMCVPPSTYTSCPVVFGAPSINHTIDSATSSAEQAAFRGLCEA